MTTDTLRRRSSFLPLLQAERALKLLVTTTWSGRTCGEPWLFALDGRTLETLGLSQAELAQLVAGGFLQHAAAGELLRGSLRAFQPTPAEEMHPDDHFLLSERGWKKALMHFPVATGQRLQRLLAASTTDRLQAKPFWDRQRRELWLSGLLIKRFRRAARDQEAILATFEEEGWPAHIDDPLSPPADGSAKKRLRNTIDHLNRCHQQEMLHFTSDGDGQGVCWRLRP